MATSWFVYSGSGSVTSPTSYAIVSGAPTCPSPKQRLCAIFAEIQFINDVERPTITGSLGTEINTAISSLTESANVRLRPNP
ncbi:hypothetical protein [Pedobacter steynii]|uniref:hypothetical protein n=1 Tax=Pedobacter steynii TaxID=430522 RepID=UPI001428CC4E|nr:hypothetical protein [Pedobacter steynii]